MIATCPHCQNGFYITPDLAGNVVACSKCKKQVRAPDRRSRGLWAPEPPKDGIPFAILEETKAEVEERLKNETEEKQKAEQQLAAEVQAHAELEAKLKAETEARARAEEAAQAEKQARAELEAKLKAELETRSKWNVQGQNGIVNLVELDNKVREAAQAKDELATQLKNEQAVRANIEQQLQAETQAKTRAEKQARTEMEGRLKAQALVEAKEEARAKAETDLVTAKAELCSTKTRAIRREPVNLDKGLLRLTVVLSLASAAIAGMLAYQNGYIISGYCDRPVHLPFLSRPVYLPLNLIAISLAGFAAAWAVYLIATFIIKGFRRQPVVLGKKQSSPQPTVDEVAPFTERKLWRTN